MTHRTMALNLWNLFPSPAGEWKAQFDPRFTSRGVFYLNEQQMVEVEVMEDAKHPLSLFIDNELEAQVKAKNKKKKSDTFHHFVRKIIYNLYFIPFYR